VDFLSLPAGSPGLGRQRAASRFDSQSRNELNTRKDVGFFSFTNLNIVMPRR
jgi:hypothetical protein